VEGAGAKKPGTRNISHIRQKMADAGHPKNRPLAEKP
jgi:hypothetical protein